MRVLVVEDAKRLRTYIGKALAKSGYAVDLATDGEEAVTQAQVHDYDVIILDLMLPKLDGVAVLRKLRFHGGKSRVLILTALDTVEDRVRGLHEGADDYLTKPFALEELEARIQALVRRRYVTENPVIKIGQLVIDTARKRATLEERPLPLKPREYALLEYLALRRGSVVSRPDIEQHVYDERIELGSNAVDAAICRLRKQIDLPNRPSLIETRRGLGYVLADT